MWVFFSFIFHFPFFFSFSELNFFLPNFASGVTHHGPPCLTKVNRGPPYKVPPRGDSGDAQEGDRSQERAPSLEI